MLTSPASRWTMYPHALPHCTRIRPLINNSLRLATPWKRISERKITAPQAAATFSCSARDPVAVGLQHGWELNAAYRKSSLPLYHCHSSYNSPPPPKKKALTVTNHKIITIQLIILFRKYTLFFYIIFSSRYIPLPPHGVYTLSWLTGFWVPVTLRAKLAVALLPAGSPKPEG